MKAYKFEVLVIDFEQLGGEELARTLQTNRYISPTVESIEERDIGEWTDDHPLNKSGCNLEYQRLFPDPVSKVEAAIEKFKDINAHEVQCGGQYTMAMLRGMELALKSLKGEY